MCLQCYKDCGKHIDKINLINVDIETLNRLVHFSRNLYEKKKIYINHNNNIFGDKTAVNIDSLLKIEILNDNQNEDNCSDISSRDNDEENLLNENYKNNDKNNEKINSDNNKDFLPILNITSEVEESIHELINIIINDYFDFPNYEHIDIISNISNFISNNHDQCNEIRLKYEINQKNFNYRGKVELFGEVFVNNNSEKFFVIINGKIMDLKKYYDLSDILEDNNKPKEWPVIFEVSLIEKLYKKVTDLSYMFYDISILNYSSDFSNFNSSKINTMSYMFYNCNTLESLPDISILDTSNVTNMSYMFYNCSEIKTLPDISKWNTNNVIDMSYLFYGCSILIEIPDISKWNTSNVTNMSYMFSHCLSLSSFPKISDWNIENVCNVNYIFFNCKSLKYEPEILKWKETISFSFKFKSRIVSTNIFEAVIY